MSFPADSQLSVPIDCQPLDAVAGSDTNLDAEAAELVFTQSKSGQYLSFYWRDAARYGLLPEQITGAWISDGFGPVTTTSYLGQIRQVLNSLQPERFTYPFRCGEHYLLFDLLVSPVLLPGRAPSTVLVLGRLLPELQRLPSLASPDAIPRDPERYQRLLTLIAWNIRRTLDLKTIWQQTVKGLGKALKADCCMIASYQPGTPQVTVVAEYREDAAATMAGLDVQLATQPQWQEALETLRPIVIEQYQVLDRVAREAVIEGLTTSHQSVLVAPTCYQEQPNGLIFIGQNREADTWSEVEIELVRELADQVGTAIAHASLFAESQALTQELQQVNDSLRQKHRELEEAHQQAEEASRLKSEFLANTSHELRTPLNGMLGFLKLVMDGMADDPEEQGEFIQEAYRSALHLLNIINDILDIAKIEAGKMQLELSPVKLQELLSDVEDFTKTQAQQKQLSFEILTPPTRDEIILFGNYQRLLQVMLNLVGNAIKFTHEGGITISAEVIKKKMEVQNHEMPAMIKLRVADTGIGVSLDKQDKLFQSFSQVDGSRTRQYGGTGLGLAISQKLVEAMGGVVNFYSMGEGLGSTVTFTVPLYQEPLMIATQHAETMDLLL